MPYEVKKSGKGFKVFSPSGPKSKAPMSKDKARAQQAAIYANTKEESAPAAVLVGGGLDGHGTGSMVFRLNEGAYEAALSALSGGGDALTAARAAGALSVADRLMAECFGRQGTSWGATMLGDRIVLEAEDAGEETTAHEVPERVPFKGWRGRDLKGDAPGVRKKGRPTNASLEVRNALKALIKDIEKGGAEQRDVLAALKSFYDTHRVPSVRQAMKTAFAAYASGGDTAALVDALEDMLDLTTMSGGVGHYDDIQSNPTRGMSGQELADWYAEQIGGIKDAFKSAIASVQPPDPAGRVPKLQKLTGAIKDRLDKALAGLSANYRPAGDKEDDGKPGESFSDF